MVNATDETRRQALHVRKLAGEPGSGEHLPDHKTGEMSLRPFIGAIFLDDMGRSTVDGVPNGDPVPPPKRIGWIPMDYAQRESWVEIVGQRPVVAPAGTVANPYSKQPHVFLHADEIVLHMVSGDYRYRVVHQPGKYEGAEHVPGAEHTATDVTGDPNTHVDWFYDADLIEE